MQLAARPRFWADNLRGGVWLAVHLFLLTRRRRGFFPVQVLCSQRRKLQKSAASVEHGSGSRRHFVTAGAGRVASHSGLIWAAAEAANKATDAQAGFVHLTMTEALNLAALADQVFPPDETPGASELGAVHFMDAALGGFMADAGELLRAGVVDLDQRAGASSTPDRSGFHPVSSTAVRPANKNHWPDRGHGVFQGGPFPDLVWLVRLACLRWKQEQTGLGNDRF